MNRFYKYHQSKNQIYKRQSPWTNFSLKENTQSHSSLLFTPSIPMHSKINGNRLKITPLPYSRLLPTTWVARLGTLLTLVAAMDLPVPWKLILKWLGKSQKKKEKSMKFSDKKAYLFLYLDQRIWWKNCPKNCRKITVGKLLCPKVKRAGRKETPEPRKRKESHWKSKRADPKGRMG